MKRRPLSVGIALLVIVSLSACATHRPVVDMRGVDSAAFEADLVECQRYAEQVSPAGNAGVGAVVGTVVGGLLGAAIGNSRLASRMAGAGAVGGAASGAGHGAETQVNVIRNCLSGRGYRVLS